MRRIEHRNYQKALHLNLAYRNMDMSNVVEKKRGDNVKNLWSFENKGYYLVKDESKCLFNVIVDISEEKYMTVLSPYFDTLSGDDAREFSEILGSNFKSEVIAMPCTENYQFKGRPYRFMFSDTYNAFEEDIYVYDASPEFVQECFSQCKSDHPYAVEYINYGGAFKGLEISLFFDNADVNEGGEI